MERVGMKQHDPEHGASHQLRPVTAQKLIASRLFCFGPRLFSRHIPSYSSRQAASSAASRSSRACRPPRASM